MKSREELLPRKRWAYNAKKSGVDAPGVLLAFV